MYYIHDKSGGFILKFRKKSEAIDIAKTYTLPVSVDKLYNNEFTLIHVHLPKNSYIEHYELDYRIKYYKRNDIPFTTSE